MVSIWYGFVCLMISIPLSEAIQCQGSAIYTLTFKAEWTNDSHLDFPPNPHFSRLVGCSHNSSYVMWRPGVNATIGVKDVAELGKNDAINNEMDEQIKLKNALARYQGPGISGGTGTAKQAGINVNSQYPLLSVITMIAPSPDWFIGVRDYSLCNETSGKWVEKRVKELFPYDSGTDSGPRFKSSDQVTTPHEPIFLINNTEEGSFKSDKPIKRFGTFTFEKTFESKPSTTTTTNIISPEPTTTQLATAVMASSIVISIPLSEVIQCKGSAIYTLTFKAEWTKDSHLDFPPNPHFSRLVGCSHNSSYVMWRPGSLATLGVQRVAERGKNDVINNEMDEQIRLKNALARYQGPGISGGTGTATQAGINVNSEYPLVSVITMIAPSPDWFIGVRDYSLCNETSGKWVEKSVKELFPYDSGTDSGPRFTSSDQVTTPHVPIFLINNTEEGSFKSDKPIKRFGTFTFKKTSESTVEPPITTANNKTMSPKSTTMQVMTNATTPSRESTKQTTAGACSLANLNIHVFSILIIISSFFMYTEN